MFSIRLLNICRIVLITIGFTITTSIYAQHKNYTVANTHSHNDYDQAVPFYTAYYAGFGSIEANVILKNEALYIAHDSVHTSSNRTLESLYLQPLADVIKANNGYVYKDTTKQLILLIDLKTAAVPTLAQIIKVLGNYKQITNCHSLKLVITGNQPAVANLTSYPDYIYFDGNVNYNYTPDALEKVWLYSTNFKNYTKWYGKGIPVAADRIKLEKAVKAAHQLNKPIRFWAAPDLPNAWYQLMHLGVDFINTDKIFELASFLNKLPANSYQSSSAAGVYKPTYKYDNKNTPVKNVIFLIGDGMGLAHIYAAYTANFGQLNIFNIRSTGLSATNAADNYITDSGGGGTAMATGKKTNNRHIGVDATGAALVQMPAVFKQKGKSTAVITSGDIADATPASFYAHHAERDSLAAITKDFLSASVDILMGFGGSNFSAANTSLLSAFKKAGVVIHTSVNDPINAAAKTLVLNDKAGLTIEKGRGDFLLQAINKSLTVLNKNKAGFLLVAEGAKIDLGGHTNNMATVITELLDFDKVVGAAMQWADEHEGTLVIVTADHETGGLTLMDGDIKKGYVSGHFSTEDHTGIAVPVFAYGPQSGIFSGFYSNTEIFKKIVELVK